MQEADSIARENAQKSAQRNKRIYDSKIRSSVLYPGDLVLIRNLTPRGGPGKLRNHWEDTIHTVVRRVGKDVPIYELRPEQGKGKSRTLHQNLLLPCNHLPLEVEVCQPVKQKQKTTVTNKVSQDSEEEDDEDDPEENFPAQSLLSHGSGDKFEILISASFKFLFCLKFFSNVSPKIHQEK